jgi:hypothetical protein
VADDLLTSCIWPAGAYQKGMKTLIPMPAKSTIWASFSGAGIPRETGAWAAAVTADLVPPDFFRIFLCGGVGKSCSFRLLQREGPCPLERESRRGNESRVLFLVGKVRCNALCFSL